MLFSATSNSNRDSPKRRSFIKWILKPSTASCNTAATFNRTSYYTKLELNDDNNTIHNASVNRLSEESNQSSYTETPQRKSYLYSSIQNSTTQGTKITIKHYEHQSHQNRRESLSNRYSLNSPVSTKDQPPTKEFVSDIPARRTSRNYSGNPEIQAKMNALLNSDRATYISNLLQQQQKQRQQL